MLFWLQLWSIHKKIESIWIKAEDAYLVLVGEISRLLHIDINVVDS